MPPKKATRASAASSAMSTPSKGMAKMSLSRNNSSKNNVNGKRKRVATSDEEEESEEELKVNGKGNATAKANSRGVKPYVEISRSASAASLASTLSRSSSAGDLNRSGALSSLRSRRNTSTPRTSEPPHTSDGEILDDESLQYEDKEEEESGSDFKEEEEDSLSDVSNLNVEGMELSGDEEEDLPKKGKGKKVIAVKKVSQVQRKVAINWKKPGAVIDLDEDEDQDEEEQMVQAAIKASYASAADAILADLASAGAGSSRSRGERTEMSVSPKKNKAPAKKKKEERRSPRKVSVKKTTKKVTKMVVEDDDDSDDDFVEESDAMEVDESSGSEDAVAESGSALSEADSEIIMKAVIEKAKEALVVRKKNRIEDVAYKKELRKVEMAERKRLGRNLTYAEKTTLALYRHHPELKTVWGDLEKREVIKPEVGLQPEGLKVKLLPFQLESMTWMRKQESGVWNGGMLADEMGMGKTIQTLGLLVNDRRKPNLVVAPTVAIMQWRNEIDQHTTGFSVYVFHGASRTKEIEELKKHDVVLTTYSVLESVFRKQNYGFKRKGALVKEQSPLHAINWARIILDEAHNIKERSTSTAKAAFELKSTHKWCLSGTPLQNRVGELYSLVRFLGGDPFSYYFCKRCDCKSLHWKFTDKRSCDTCGHSPTQHVCLWNNEILGPIQKHGLNGPGHDAFRKLRILLDRMMLRRTKLERADDLGLPPRTVIVRRDYFSPEEKELYLSLFSDAKRQFSTYVDSGTLLNNYSNIFTLITRMRQMACHPDLVLKSKRNVELAGDIVEATVCRICNDIAEDAIKSKCHHIFDRECIRQYLEAAVDTVPECPVCHLPLTIDLEAEAIEISEEQMNKAKQGILGRLDLDEWKSSSKIEALVEELSNLRQQDRTIKSLVFSQFVNFLDLIAFRLKRAGFNICRLEGTMTPQARDLTIKHFMNNVDVTVFLVSLKAGGVALNLTEASRVYLMDSWWNPAVEFQAMDRIHRLGQHRPVQAIKLVIEDSIESRIIQLQEKKSAMVDATLSTDDSAMGRLTPEDLGFLFRL